MLILPEHDKIECAPRYRIPVRVLLLSRVMSNELDPRVSFTSGILNSSTVWCPWDNIQIFWVY